MKYIYECSTGLCHHLEHKVNAMLWIVPLVALTYIVVKYRYDANKNRGK